MLLWNLRFREMTKLGVVCKVDEPTSWLDSKVSLSRLCLDPADLNKVYSMPASRGVKTELVGLCINMMPSNIFYMYPVVTTNNFQKSGQQEVKFFGERNS